MKKLKLLSMVNGGLRCRTIVITDDVKAYKLAKLLQEEVDSFHCAYIAYARTLAYQLFEMKTPLENIRYDIERKFHIQRKYKFLKKFRMCLPLSSWFNLYYAEDEKERYYSLLLISSRSAEFKPTIVVEDVIYFNEDL